MNAFTGVSRWNEGIVGRHLDGVVTQRADNRTNGSQHLSFDLKFKYTG